MRYVAYSYVQTLRDWNTSRVESTLSLEPAIAIGLAICKYADLLGYSINMVVISPERDFVKHDSGRVVV
jgi:hypothetical protein